MDTYKGLTLIYLVPAPILTLSFPRVFRELMNHTQATYLFAGYEVVGFEKIPASGPALIIYYHGTLPIDLYYMVAKMIVLKDRQLRAVGDRFLFKIPGRLNIIVTVHYCMILWKAEAVIMATNYSKRILCAISFTPKGSC